MAAWMRINSRVQLKSHMYRPFDLTGHGLYTLYTHNNQFDNRMRAMHAYVRNGNIDWIFTRNDFFQFSIELAHAKK